MTRLLPALLWVVVVACGGEGSGLPAMPDAPSTPTPDAPPIPDGWQELVARDWVIPAGSFDTYKCARVRIQQDTWVAGFRAIAPQGTHHTVVTISTKSTPLGDYDCNAGTLDNQMLYASGVATDDLLFPDGVAMQLKAGQYINLNLHLFNATEGDITGHSGILFKQIDAAAVQHEADMVFAGDMRFSIPPGDNQTVVGGCTLSSEWHVFTLWPHMHQFAKHQKVVVTRPGEPPMTLLDGAYDFNEQVNYPTAEPLVLPANTKVEVTCTYNNTTGSNITFGDSSNQEMCFTGMYKWPAGGSLFQCASF